MNDAIKPELQKAVALYYDGRGAPQITAKGEGDAAEEIIALAQQHGVPLCDNPALVELLAQIELGDQIPESLYITVAHLLAFAAQLRGLSATDPVMPGPHPLKL